MKKMGETWGGGEGGGGGEDWGCYAPFYFLLTRLVKRKKRGLLLASRREKEKGILTGKGSDILYHYAFFYAMRTQTFGRPTK